MGFSTTALTVASLVGTAASAGAGIYGATQQTAAAQNNAKAQADQNNYLAQVAANNAELERKKGDAEAAELQRQNSVRQGAMRAALAANGGDPNAGSALLLQDDLATAGGLDVANTRWSAALRALSGEQTASLQRTAGKNALAAGDIAASNAMMGGVGNLLASASQFSSRFGAWQSTGNNALGAKPGGYVSLGTGTK